MIVLYAVTLFLPGALLGALAGHAAAGMSRKDLKELGEHLDAGQAGLVVVGVSDLEAKVERVKKVTPEAVQRVARRLLRPERLTVACVGMLTKKLEREVRGIVEKFK